MSNLMGEGELLLQAALESKMLQLNSLKSEDKS